MTKKNQSTRLTNQHKISKGVVGIFGDGAKSHDVTVGEVSKFVINQLHLTVQSCHLKITSALSTVQEQVFLGLAEGEPYIQEEQTTYLSNGSVFELTFNRRHYANYEFQTVIVEQ